MESLEVTFLPCTCTHERRDHVIRSREADGSTSSALLHCTHDKAYFRGMCMCSSYNQMSNLEFLEWKSKLNDNKNS